MDAAGRQIGQIVVERTENELIVGKFMPGPAFCDVQPLFHQFEDAVNLQALHLVDKLDTAISALGLRVGLPEDLRSLPIHDVQIWSDGSVTCRLSAVDDLDQQIARTRQNAKLVALLDERARETETVPLEEVKRELGLGE